MFLIKTSAIRIDRSTLMGLALGFALCLPLTSHAYLTVGESADVTPQGILKIGIEPQIRMSEGSGANLTGFVDGAVSEDLSYRVQLGAGETDLVFGGSMKWVPFPDFEKQPAIGFRGDLIFGREQNENFTTVRLAPMMSKQLQTDYVLFTPYVALPVGLTSFKGKSDSIGQLALGTDIKIDEFNTSMFNVELGANLNRTFSYISFNYVYLLGSDGGLKLRRRTK